MNTTKSHENLRALVESAILVAIAYALSYIRFNIMPNGGSVTLVSMLPLLMIGLRHGLKWGLCGGVVYAGLQMLQQIWAPPSGTLAAWTAMILLDYLLAFSVLGLSGLFKNRQNGILYAIPLCLLLRFMCHFLSGVVIWGNYLDSDSWIFSLGYNASYMLPELVFTMIVGVVLYKTAPVLFTVNQKAVRA